MADVEDRTRILAIVAAKLVGGDLAGTAGDNNECRYFNDDGDLLEKEAVADACLLLSAARKAVLSNKDL